MTGRLAAISLTRWKTRALACTGATAIGAPIDVGILLGAPSIRAQFDASSQLLSTRQRSARAQGTITVQPAASSA